MSQKRSSKKLTLIEEFEQTVGADPLTNEIIGFLAVKNAEYLGKYAVNYRNRT